MPRAERKGRNAARRCCAWLLASAASLGVSIVPLAADPAAEPFPEYESIRPEVGFWKRVWAEWSLGQAAVHHVDAPDLVYEIVDLPGPIEDSYTRQQRDFLEEVRDRWADRLEQLATLVRTGAALADPDKRLALDIATRLGSQALDEAAGKVRTQRGQRERFGRGVEISFRYDPLFREIFREAGLPEDLAYLPHVESSFQAAARSHAGAVGIWQFTRGTGRRYLAITSAIDERLDPIAAARGAARYLREAFDQLGSWPIALTAYNHGVQGMRKAVERHGADYEVIRRDYNGRAFGFASKNFYAEFLAAREVARAWQQYFPQGLQPERPHDLEHVQLEHRASPTRIAAAWGFEPNRLAVLNPAWSRRAIDRGLTLPAGTVVWLPPGTHDDLASRGVSMQLLPSVGDDATVIHRVRRGDTLSDIAAAYGMSLDELRDRNGLGARQSLIRVGQRLKVRQPTDLVHYEVRRGDTLTEIAQAHGLSLRELRRLNAISGSGELIRPGQRLLVTPAVPEQTHVVKSGETLTRIAGRYGVRVADLLTVNSLSLQSLIFPGQPIRIPQR